MLPSELSNSALDPWGRMNGGAKTINSESNVMSLQGVKSKHIAQLCLLPYKVIELKKDLEFKIVINKAHEFSIFMTLPPLFPQERPQFRLSSPLPHPWVTDVFIDKCPHLSNFGVHTNLNQVVKDIVEEMIQVHALSQMNLQSTAFSQPGYRMQSYVPHSINPHPNAPVQASFPNLLTFAPANETWSPSGQKFLSHYDPAYPSTASTTSQYDVPSNFNLPIAQNICAPSASSVSSAASLHHNKTIEITSVQDLDQLSTEEILLTLKDPERLESLVMSCHGRQIEAYRTRRREVAKQLQELAGSNLNRAEALEEKKSLLAEKCKQHNELQNKILASAKLLEEKSNSIPDPEVVFDSLRVVTMEAEEKSDTIAKSFTEGKMTIEDFSKAFLEQRKLFHTRSIKCNKFNEHLCYGPPI